MNREKALEIVRKYVKNENLIRHMLAVEAAMAAYAVQFGEDEERWRVRAYYTILIGKFILPCQTTP
jgi:predicted hydrolase (HD superfamily)